jgi:16S rRNA (cytosine1402-N4)-methyltransferase
LEKYIYHTPVLLQEVLKYLLTEKNGFYVDGTLGGGGHAKAVFQELDCDGKVIGIDLDDDALEASGRQLEQFGDRYRAVKGNFRNIKSVLSQLGINSVQGILLDLGVSSFQIDAAEKGFSFRSDAPLDMRMDRSQKLDARHILNQYDEQSLADIFRKYGEEKQANRIARAVVRYRINRRIESTGQLSALVEQTVGGRFLIKTLARIFQSVRIEVNGEIENLRLAIKDSADVLNPGGRIVIISYHSLEDRLVKEAFRSLSAKMISSGNKIAPDIPVKPVLKIMTRKPVTASEKETAENIRARSAKLRAAEKVQDN